MPVSKRKASSSLARASKQQRTNIGKLRMDCAKLPKGATLLFNNSTKKHPHDVEIQIAGAPSVLHLHRHIVDCETLNSFCGSWTNQQQAIPQFAVDEKTLAAIFGHCIQKKKDLLRLAWRYIWKFFGVCYGLSIASITKMNDSGLCIRTGSVRADHGEFQFFTLRMMFLVCNYFGNNRLMCNFITSIMNTEAFSLIAGSFECDLVCSAFNSLYGSRGDDQDGKPVPLPITEASLTHLIKRHISITISFGKRHCCSSTFLRTVQIYAAAMRPKYDKILYVDLLKPLRFLVELENLFYDNLPPLGCITAGHRECLSAFHFDETTVLKMLPTLTTKKSCETDEEDEISRATALEKRFRELRAFCIHVFGPSIIKDEELAGKVAISGSIMPMFINHSMLPLQNVQNLMYPEADVDIYVTDEDALQKLLRCIQEIHQCIEVSTREYHKDSWSYNIQQKNIIITSHPNFFYNRSLYLDFICVTHRDKDKAVSIDDIVIRHHVAPVRAYVSLYKLDIRIFSSSIYCFLTGYICEYRPLDTSDSGQEISDDVLFKYYLRDFKLGLSPDVTTRTIRELSSRYSTYDSAVNALEEKIQEHPELLRGMSHNNCRKRVIYVLLNAVNTRLWRKTTLQTEPPSSYF